MYNLEQVLNPGFSRSWQEAVAIVQEVAVTLGDLNTLPAPEDLFLEEDATIAIGFASEEAKDPVTSLASLLLRLLDGISAPPQLLSLATDNAKTPPAHATVEGFMGALAFYERPDRKSDVRAVVTRLSARHAALTAEEELERLRQRLVVEDDENAADDKKTDTTKDSEQKRKRPAFKLPRFSLRESAIAAGIVIALLGTVAGAGLARGRSARTPTPESPVAETANAPEEPADLPAKSSSASGSLPDAAPPGAATPQVHPAAAPRQKAPASRAPGHKPTAARAEASAVSRPGRQAPEATARQRSTQIPPVPLLRTAPLLSSVRSGAPAGTNGMKPGPAATDSTSRSLTGEPIAGYVYSAAEADVKPARLVRSQLPEQPAATAETGYFDIVVDEQGDVESVKLLSPMRKYQDRMLVAAAKAWKFKPALLNGTPVKYRLRIPIIVADMPR